jgi:hypothetical protein
LLNNGEVLSTSKQHETIFHGLLSCWIVGNFRTHLQKKAITIFSFWRMGDLTGRSLSVSNHIEHYILGCCAGPKKTIKTCDLSSFFGFVTMKFQCAICDCFQPQKNVINLWVMHGMMHMILGKIRTIH